tara:strand:+ start:54 stop:377 length:324 start_codon:yes stop_codon:yes gene_type:complete
MIDEEWIKEYEKAVAEVHRKLNVCEKELVMYFVRTDVDQLGSKDWWAKEVQTRLLHVIQRDIGLLAKGVHKYRGWRERIARMELEGKLEGNDLNSDSLLVYGQYKIY